MRIKRMEKLNPIIAIPSRLNSTRLPNKPLALINGKEMIIHVVERALATNLADVVIAAAEQEIMDCVNNYFKNQNLNKKIMGVLTNKDLQSGSDRIHEALNKIDPNKNYNVVINLQGDLPTIDVASIMSCFNLIKSGLYDITTIGAVILNEEDKINHNIVKAIVSFKDNNTGKALYFSRATVPYGSTELLHHIGIYTYMREALEKFTACTPSTLEKYESLEQLRALENNLCIGFAKVNTIPLGIDTKEDLEKAQNILKNII